MPFVPVRITNSQKLAIKEIAKAEGKSVSWHIVRAIKTWLEIPEHERVYEKFDPSDLVVVNVSYYREEEAIMKADLRSPIPLAIVARNACLLYLESHSKANGADT